MGYLWKRLAIVIYIELHVLGPFTSKRPFNLFYEVLLNIRKYEKKAIYGLSVEEDSV